MGKAAGVAKPARTGWSVLLPPQRGNVVGAPREGQVGNVAGGVPFTAVGGNSTGSPPNSVAPDGASLDEEAARGSAPPAAPPATENPSGQAVATVAKPEPPAAGATTSSTTSGSDAAKQPTTTGSEAGQPAAAPTASEAPLYLRLTVNGGDGTPGPGVIARVRVTASAPCHLALYRIGTGGGLTALLSLGGAGRMKPAASYSLATAMQAGDRLVALGSRRPLSGREAQACLKAFLAEGAANDPAASPGAVPLPLALQRLAVMAGGHAGKPMGDTLARSAWAVATAALPPGGSSRGADASVAGKEALGEAGKAGSRGG
jgi:hypothetical protein